MPASATAPRIHLLSAIWSPRTAAKPGWNLMDSSHCSPKACCNCRLICAWASPRVFDLSALVACSRSGIPRRVLFAGMTPALSSFSAHQRRCAWRFLSVPADIPANCQAFTFLHLSKPKAPPRSVALQPAQPVGLSRMATFSIALAKLVYSCRLT